MIAAGLLGARPVGPTGSTIKQRFSWFLETGLPQITRLPWTTARYDDAREPSRLSCSDRNSNDGRSTTTDSRSLADSLPRLADSTAHTRIVREASSRSPLGTDCGAS